MPGKTCVKRRMIFDRSSSFSLPDCGETTLNNESQKYKQGCASVYFATKAIAVFHLAILALVAAGLTLLALIFYAVVSQRARAGYAEVSHG